MRLKKKKTASYYPILTSQSSSTLTSAALSIFQLSFLKQFLLLIYANSFFHFVIVIVCLFFSVLFRPLTAQSSFLTLLLAGLNSVQDPILYSVLYSPQKIFTLISLRAICAYISPTVTLGLPLNDAPMWPSYIHFSLVSQQHAMLNKFRMIY